MSQTISSELQRFDKATMRSHQDRNRNDDRRLKKLRRNKLEYRKRKAAGLCSYGHCPERVELGNAHCRNHLQAMAKRAMERKNERIAQSLCIHCGVRPPFWGRRCIICRQAFAKHPLPCGARRALRLYRETEERQVLEQIQEDAREAVLKLLASDGVLGKAGEALRLYAGIDSGKWRTYKEVGKAMILSKERVRQLLAPSKIVLHLTLSDRVPWRPLEPVDSNGKGEMLSLQKATCAHRKDAALRISDDGSFPYEDCGLSNVLLFGLAVRRCRGCQGEAVSIPRVNDLNRVLARAVLLKPASLTGRELRFLRAVAGLSPARLAAQLRLSVQAIYAWERSETLLYRNDLVARTILAALIVPDDSTQVFKMLGSIRTGGSEPFRVCAYWINDKKKWVVSSRSDAQLKPVTSNR